jgi:hypothetical protein
LPEVQNRLFPYLELVPLPLRAVMYESGRAMRHVYFPTDSIISLQYLMENGASTAILVVGNEGLMGITLFVGGESTPSRSLVQSAGHAYRLPRKQVKEEFSRHGQLLVLMLRYTQALITQIAQTAVCNRHHSIDQQLCRWLASPVAPEVLMSEALSLKALPGDGGVRTRKVAILVADAVDGASAVRCTRASRRRGWSCESGGPR